jgi:hypothetical protein
VTPPVAGLAAVLSTSPNRFIRSPAAKIAAKRAALPHGRVDTSPAQK